MPNEKDIQSRRRFLKTVGATVAATATIGSLPRFAIASDMPHLSDADPSAKALGYVEDATKTTNASHKAGDACANCQFYTDGTAGYGPCQLFPGKSVNAEGWCVSYSKKS